MIKAVLGTKRNRLKGGKLTSSERMKRYSLIVSFTSALGKRVQRDSARSFGVSFLAYLGLRSILVLCKQAQMGEDEVLVNDYL